MDFHQCEPLLTSAKYHINLLSNMLSPSSPLTKLIVGSLLLLLWLPLLLFHLRPSQDEHQIITSSNLITHVDPSQLSTFKYHLPSASDGHSQLPSASDGHSHLPATHDDDSRTSMDASHVLNDHLSLSGDDEFHSTTTVPKDKDPESHLVDDHNAGDDTIPSIPNHLDSTGDEEGSSSCDGKYVYMYSRLPPMFNEEMIAKCREKSPSWLDICSTTSNQGLGPRLELEGYEAEKGNGSSATWYRTDHFGLDVVFHSRMKRYRCLTSEARRAAAVYVPFYAGVDSNINLFEESRERRDYLARELGEWLAEQEEWGRRGGMDHFIVTGKVGWDFLREYGGGGKGWGTALLNLPQLRGALSVLGVEASNVPRFQRVESAVPYPTYFHPRTDSDVAARQRRLRGSPRPNLFAFAGARRPEMPSSIRSQLMEQCRASPACTLLEFARGAPRYTASSVLDLFQASAFCLQPPGDSFTRRSFFDALICGCIPVLFNPHTAYTQYLWHLPRDPASYSVFIPEDAIRNGTALVEAVLRAIPRPRVRTMRETIVHLLPNLVYAHPDGRLENFRDAFDVALEGIIRKVGDNIKAKERRTTDQQQEVN